jgi:hypothetical protein
MPAMNDQRRSPTPRAHAVALLLALGAFACSSRSALLPNVEPAAGQIPANYQMEVTRGLLLARISVVTNDDPGFGPITNPLVLEFQPVNAPAEVLDPLGRDTRVWTTDSQRPSQWHYASPGLLAMSVVTTTYGGMLIAYPDPSHADATPSSIPEPSTALAFAPLEVRPGEITYVGDIEIRQSVSGWDRLLDRVEVSYVVTDEYDRTVADFRARYPQFADAAVKRQVIKQTTEATEEH